MPRDLIVLIVVEPSGQALQLSPTLKATLATLEGSAKDMCLSNIH